MSLENELKHFQDELKMEQEKLAKFEALDPSSMDDTQLKAYNRGIKGVKSSIAEIEEIIEEIKAEMGE